MDGTPDFFAALQKQHQINLDHKQRASLIDFFRQYNCPQPYYINDYLSAADKDHLDYRLLPAISMQESTCGKSYPVATHNLWGWQSARISFLSIPQGIEFVSKQLAEGSFYKDKTLDQKLRAYNPNPAYAGEVERLMGEISK